MGKFSVLIEARPFCAFDKTPMEQLRNSGMELIDMRGSGLENSKFIDALKQVDAILCGNDLVVNDEVLEMAPRVRAIAKLGAGLDTVDIQAATRHNALVFHTPGANNQAVADHTFALILNVARRIITATAVCGKNAGSIPKSWVLKSGRKLWDWSAWVPLDAVWLCGPKVFR